jgi:hypothetical protein
MDARDLTAILSRAPWRSAVAPLMPTAEARRIRGRRHARGPGCNTPDVYRLLDNEYGFKHVISVNKTDAKF